MTELVDAVSNAVRSAAERAIVPRFRAALVGGDIREVSRRLGHGRGPRE